MKKTFYYFFIQTNQHKISLSEKNMSINSFKQEQKLGTVHKTGLGSQK